MRYFKCATRLTRTVTLLILGFAILATASAADASIVVIANPSIQLKHLTKVELSDLYLGKPISLGTSQPVQPYNQPDNSSAYQQFYQTILGWTPSQVSSYWTRLVFSGEANQPPTVGNDAAAIATVEHSKNAIAYVNSKSLADVGNRVKVIYGHYKPPVVHHHRVAHHIHHRKHLYSSSKSGAYMTALSSNKSAYARAPTTDPDTALAKQLTSINSKQTGQNLWSIISQNMRMTGQTNNAEVRHWILWFEQHRKILNTLIDNATPYLYYIYHQTQQRHMPAEFTLLPMIESGFNPNAYSYAGAAGLWQMMPGTASSYGLTIDWWYDSRRDILTSTNSALNYLQRLHTALGTWYLAAAAYNEGPGALRAEIDKNKRAGKPTDYWSLALPKQTKQYVPKLLALAAIVSDPSKYGVSLPYVPDRPFFGSVTLTSQMDLKEMSMLSGVSIPIIKELNPGLRRFSTAPDMKFTLLLPVMAVDTFKDNLQSVIGKRHISWQYHEVHSNENLSKIAKNYHTSSVLLKKVNRLSNDSLSPGEGILVPIHLHHTYTHLASVSGNATMPKRATQKILARALKKASESQKKPLPKEVTGVPIKNSDSLKTLLGKLYAN